MRRLIINADDFGLAPGVNQGIVEAHAKGILTSATLMANGPEFEQAAQLAKTAGLDVGCHVVLLDGRPLLSEEQIPSLVARAGNQDAQFRGGFSNFAVAALRRTLVAEEIEAEATAQIRKLQSAGLAVSHLDSHKHAHIFPQVLQPLLRAAKECGVGAVRNPFEALRFSTIAKRPGLWKRWAATRALGGFAEGFRRLVLAARMMTPDGSIGIVATGSLDQPLLSEMLRTLPEGTWELVCHPGYLDAQLRGTGTRLRESRAQELQLIASLETRDLLMSNDIELVSYRDIL